MSARLGVTCPAVPPPVRIIRFIIGEPLLRHASETNPGVQMLSETQYVKRYYSMTKEKML